MKKSIKDLELKGRRVLMRVDFNVPLDDRQQVTDDTRIRASLPSIEYVLKHGGKLILMSHLGRPKGGVEPEFSMSPASKKLGELLGRRVYLLNDCVGARVEKAVSGMRDGDILMLENLRFHAEEEKNDPSFSKQLASLGDIFVNDAFGTCHRAHASTEGVTKYLPSVSGFLVQKEIEYFEKVNRNPDKPFVLILGGAKITDKIGVITNLLDKVDKIIIGGAMAYAFLKAKGVAIGNSKCENEAVSVAKDVMDKAHARKVTIALPMDHVVANGLEDSAEIKNTDGQAVEAGWIGLDIGHKTVEYFKDELKGAKTVVWNGPLGFFEKPKFSKGTEVIARYLAGSGATTIIGGGDTAAAIAQLGLDNKMSHISTGGGASLEYLEGKTLPGIAALQDKQPI